MQAEGRNFHQQASPQAQHSTVLELRCLTKGAKANLSIRVNFCELPPTQTQLQHDGQGSGLKFNPALLLPEFSQGQGRQMRAFCESGSKASFECENELIFQRLMEQTEMEQSGQSTVKRARPMSTYCQVCKEPFLDYLQHLEHPAHIRKMQHQRNATTMIDELVSSFKYETKRARSERMIRSSQFDDEDTMPSASKIRYGFSGYTNTDQAAQECQDQSFTLSQKGELITSYYPLTLTKMIVNSIYSSSILHFCLHQSHSSVASALAKPTMPGPAKLYIIIIDPDIQVTTMASRYQTLNVSLQTDNPSMRNQSRMSQTLDYGNDGGDGGESGEADEKVKKFRELYYRNEKLRRELKMLNQKLNEKLEKVKFPIVKKRAASVDLNREPPNKALQRELENAYKQIKMYKQQIQVLKVKQQTPENYAKLKDMENMIAFKDKQIAQVQEQLKSVKNIKKMQEKKIQSELENEQVKQRLQNYEKQHKQLRQKLKQMVRKTRRRDEQYKKQQAYLVSLSKKYRIATDDRQLQSDAPAEKVQRPNREVSDTEFKQVKAEIQKQKRVNDQILKKFQMLKKQVKALRDQNTVNNEKYKQKDALSKMLQTKIIALNRLIKQQQKKPKEPPKNPLITNIEEVEIDQQQYSEIDPIATPKEPTISKQDQSLKKMLNEMDEVSQRQWKGKYRKVQHGFGAPGDKKFQFQGVLAGFQVSLDENQGICGIIFIFQDGSQPRYEPIQGKRSNIEIKWELKPGDSILKLTGSFTEQSYLNEIVVVTKNGNAGVFGSASTDLFNFRLNENQKITGVFGAIRELGADRKITELGFWLEKS